MRTGFLIPLAGVAFTALLNAQNDPVLLGQQALDQAVAVRPHPRQIDWQRREFISFIHFGMNTFTGREWGTGNEDPAVFNPTALDARQWVEVCRSAGMKQIILTAKHHDGFCLWPSHFTPHSVRRSPWKQGQGDVVRELADACHAAGMKMGIYLSPADLNAIERGIYGGKNPPVARVIPSPVTGWKPKSDQRFEGIWDDYNTYFLNQLFELLTEYGEISEVWFDGANPKPGTGQKYAYQDWYRLIRALQPGAVIFGKGPDVRWIGNEAGGSRAEEWSVIPIPVPPEQFDWPDMTGKDLGSRARLTAAAHWVWYPAETDVSIRPGWFYHAHEDSQVKSLERLLDIYYRSVGGNSVFLLNLPPDPRGLIHESDARRMKELGQVLRATFAANLASGAQVTVSPAGTSAVQALVDGRDDTFWQAEAGALQAELQLRWPQSRRLNVASIQEHLASGQRIEACSLEAWVDGQWKELGRATTVGYKRLLRFEEVECARVRWRITAARACPAIAEVGLFRAPEILTPPVIRGSPDGKVTISGPAKSRLYYTVDGSKPSLASQVYGQPLALPHGGTVRALAVGGANFLDVGRGAEATLEMGLPKANWKVVSASSEEISAGQHQAAKALDGNPATFWHTRWSGETPGYPHEIIIDLGALVEIAGFGYLPRQDGKDGGLIARAEFYVSKDGKTWGNAVAVSDFGNILNNPVLQRVRLAKPISGQFIRMVALASPNRKPWAGAAEVEVYCAP